MYIYSAMVQQCVIQPEDTYNTYNVEQQFATQQESMLSKQAAAASNIQLTVAEQAGTSCVSNKQHDPTSHYAAAERLLLRFLAVYR